MEYKHTASFGKRAEYFIIAQMLNEGLDCFVPLVDDEGIDVVVKKGREFFFDGKLKVSVDYACDIVEAVISNVQEGATLPEKDSGLEVYFGSEGQTAWDIARDMRVDEDTIYSQNPDVSFPLQKDENLVVFYQKRP